MADDRDARIARLEAELQEARAAHESDRVATGGLVRDNAALHQQANAMSDVLRAIASSATDVNHVLTAICETAARLCEARNGVLLQIRARDGQLAPRALVGPVPLVLEDDGATTSDPFDFERALGSIVAPTSTPGRAFLEGRVIHVHDLASVVESEYPDSRELQARVGIRTVVFVPLLRNGNAVGVLSMQRFEVRPFSPQQIALLEVFADQAVIAIENARLFEELHESNASLREALEQQTATADVLRVIASSPTDLDSVLQSILDTAARLCDAEHGVIQQRRESDGLLASRAGHGKFRRPLDGADGSYGQRFFETQRGVSITMRSIGGRAFLERRPIAVDDVLSQDEYPEARENSERGGEAYRSQLGVPLLRRGEPIGMLSLVRSDVRPFVQRDIERLQMFADQAVIAIENARLFEELGRRNAELQESNRQITEALEQQTATAEILRIIASSPTDVHSVLTTIAEAAVTLCDSDDAVIRLVDGDHYVGAAGFGPLFAAVGTRFPIDRNTPSGRVILDGKTLVVDDLSATAEQEFPGRGSLYRAAGIRSNVVVPLLREGIAIGTIGIRRMEVRPYTGEEVALLEMFADQAVIAIENARLFQELEQRNAQLHESNGQVTESLKQQTATAEVLRVIAASPTDLHRVLQAITDMATRLCGAEACALHQRVDDGVVPMAVTGERFQASRAVAERLGHDMTGDVNQRGSVTMLALRESKTIYVPDIESAGEEYPYTLRMARLVGYQAQASAPLLRGDTPIGVITLYGFEPDSFSEQQVTLLESFADQAVIAIENARLFEELQDRVDELRALGEVIQALSSSLDLQEVLTTIVGNATRLAGADGGIVYEYDAAEGVFEVRAADRAADDLAATLQAARFRLGEGAVGRAGATRSPVEVEDIATSDVLTADVRERLLTRGMRSILAVPLLRQDEVLGGLVMARKVAGSFPPVVVALLETFATQSALAIHNGRLYQALQEASGHKSDFLASMSHELRTPLNAIIGYSEMLQEEADDLGEEAFLPDLRKINAAGKHLLGLINDILDLSKIEAGKMDLFLEDFPIPDPVRDVAAIVQPLMDKNANTLVVECPEDLGTMHADLTKLRQALFNLLSNAAKFTDHGTVTLAVQREAGDWLTFSVSDTGIGMTDEQIGRLFEAFSQAEASTRTKYGGTGLGLAISRQFCRLMGGDIDVTSEPGRGSRFTIRLPSEVADRASP